MSTALQIINLALKQINVVRFGQTASSDLRSDALEVLNQMLGEWSNVRLLVPCVTWVSHTLTSGDGTYTVGASGADITDTRPEDIDRAFIRGSDSTDHPLRIIDEASWMRIRTKSMTSRPSVLWYNPSVPNGTINLYPIPNAAETLYYSNIEPFAEPATEGASVVVPRGYDAPIMWNLAVRLGSMLGRPVDPIIVDQAQKAYASLVALNAVRRAKPAVLDITKVSPLYDLGEGGGEALEGLIIE